ncbi:MAG: hypothetical protein ABI977_13435 [Acidobacteriota bacterium]
MAAKISRRLVIDASVARSSGGEDATFPTSKHCRDFLKAALSICHCIVLTPEIQSEWHKHQSNFARRWLVSMFARKKVEQVGSVANQNLRDKIHAAAENEKTRAAMLKDVHLLEAAMATDETIIALDEIVRELFAKASKSVGEIRSVIWVNPDKADEKSLDWLEGGAKAEKKRRLSESG